RKSLEKLNQDWSRNRHDLTLRIGKGPRSGSSAARVLRRHLRQLLKREVAERMGFEPTERF
ncbi:hypothetical protein, partial [uncultured Maricaulis sp.]|uniref:hypothetical protein n=1 Tax=uncultured Maricaulis sp. TaxID=174710 RepID=UPI002601150E